MEKIVTFDKLGGEYLRKEYPFLNQVLDGAATKWKCGCGNVWEDEESLCSYCPKCGSSGFSEKKGRKPLSPEFVVIGGIDLEFLNSVPSSYDREGTSTDFFGGTKIHFVLADGTIVWDAVLKSCECGRRGQKRFGEGENTLHAMERRGIIENVNFIVEHHYGIYNGENCSYGDSLTIRKFKKED